MTIKITSKKLILLETKSKTFYDIRNSEGTITYNGIDLNKAITLTEQQRTTKVE